MADYYSILGLSKTATDIEIKSAFRRLAKVYHPDKNPNDPNAKYLFEEILRAYNVLINPHSKKRYDNNFSYTSQPSAQKTQTRSQKTKGQKEWDTTEEDIKRRGYYKKHYQAKKNTVKAEVEKPHYSDYKYILYATPIAVGLLMMIVSIFSTDPKTKATSQKTKEPIAIEPSKQFVNGDKPYSGYFGDLKLFDTPHTLQINNSTEFDAVIAIFDKKTNAYLQHAYLQASYSIEFSKLPDTGVYWKCMLGKNWSTNKTLANNKICGAFDSIVQYQNWKKIPVEFKPDDLDELNLLYVINPDSKNKQYISNDIEFFEK